MKSEIREIDEDGTTFDEWFYILSHYLREDLKYTGEIDKYYFRIDYENQRSCEDAALHFIQSKKQI